MQRSIAAGQTIPIRGDVRANVEQHVRLAEIAAEERAQVLVFPELSLTGYELDLGDDLAFTTTDRRLEPLVDAASSHSMTLVVGAPVRMESRLYIGALILGADRTVDLYTKHYMGAFSAAASRDGVVPPAEATFFHPGDRNPLIDVGGNVAAVAVCADTQRPAHVKRAAVRGANTFLASMFVIASELTKETANLPVYAAQHSMAVVFANYGGPSGGLASGGRSAIWSPSGELLAQLGTMGAGVAVACERDDRWSAKTVDLGAR